MAALSARAEALLRAQDEALWAAWTQGAPVDLNATYAANESLFTVQAIQDVEALREATADPLGRRALDHLHAYVVGEYLARGTAEVTQALAELDASVSFLSGGEPRRLRDLERLLANEKSAVKRRRLYQDATGAIARINQRVARRDLQVSALLAALGTDDQRFGEELRGVSLPAAAARADAILTRTQATYLKVMDRLAHAELQTPFSLVRTADLPRLFRPEVVDRAFPQPQVLPRIRHTLFGLGLSLEHIPGIHLDLEEQSGKRTRGLTLRVGPEDVRVSLSPADGLHAQMAALHEVGHALHDGFTRQPRFELAKLGNAAASEGFAQLFEDLAEDPTWLAQQAGLGGSRLARYRSAAAARKLFLVRREAARLLFEIAHVQDPKADPASLYAPILARALGMPVDADDAARALYDEVELFGSTDPLRAWIFAAQLQKVLATRFGAAWWTRADAGTFLRGLWANGTALTPGELLVSVGEPGLDPGPLLERLEDALDT